MPRFAAIDLGSNALRLRIVEAQPAPDEPSPPLSSRSGLPRERFTEIASMRVPVRLGTGVYLDGRLTTAAIGQACTALREFREAMDEAKVDVYRATATSAVRDAKNGALLVERARREAGIDVDVIEGVEEARLIKIAVLGRVPLEDRTALLVDVGGGSTEVTLLDRGAATFSMSLQLGTVRLLETYLGGGEGTGSRRAMRLLEEGVARAFAEIRPHVPPKPVDLVIGMGGNSETLAVLCPGRAPGAMRAIDVGALQPLVQSIAKMSLDERCDKLGLRPDRADTLLPAAAIFRYAAEMFQASIISAPGVGLKEGILEELVARHFHTWDTLGEEAGVIAACVTLGRRYRFDEAHGRLVASFAGTLFDAIAPSRGLDARDRLLLSVAAWLHDIGDFVRYDAHHKHSYYLIQHSDIMGLAREEREIVANVARYHRKGPPDTTHPNFRDLDKAARSKVRALSSILRVADALDREHLGKVRQLTADVEKRRLVLRPSGDEARELEEWSVGVKSPFLTDVFDLDVVLA